LTSVATRTGSDRAGSPVPIDPAPCDPVPADPVPADPTPARPGFQVAVTGDGRVYVAINGDLDVTTMAALTDHLAGLADLRPARLVIDLSGVSYLDCGSAWLLASTAALLPAGQQPVLSSARPLVRRMLELTELARLFELRD
jgi:anti-anti-sigma factor